MLKKLGYTALSGLSAASLAFHPMLDSDAREISAPQIEQI